MRLRIPRKGVWVIPTLASLTDTCGARDIVVMAWLGCVPHARTAIGLLLMVLLVGLV